MSKGVLSREVTRREFMKLTAKGLAGVGLSSSMLRLFDCTKAQAESGQVKVYPNSEYVLVVNAARCTGCQRCEINCTLANDGKSQPWLGRINARDNFQYGPEVKMDYLEGPGVFGNWSITPATCHQCENAPCMLACPVGAIYPDKLTSVRLLDQETCIGCGACVKACPYGMPKIDPEKGKSTKCIACGACVAGCPTSALKIVLYEDIAAAL